MPQTATPLHFGTEMPPRVIAVCEAEAPLCPRCGHRFPGLTVGDGWALKKCFEGRGGQHCGGRAFILGAGRLCVVMMVTQQEMHMIREGGRNAVELVRELGALTEPLAA